jgi:hypothetical protein
MSLKGLECAVSKLVNSDTRPRPTTQERRGLARLELEPYGQYTGSAQGRRWIGRYRIGMLTQGGRGGPPAPLDPTIP